MRLAIPSVCSCLTHGSCIIVACSYQITLHLLIEALVNGRAFGILRKYSKILEDIKFIAEKGAEFGICRNCMRHFGVEKAESPPFFDIVPGRAGDLVRKEHDGYPYIKP